MVVETEFNFHVFELCTLAGIITYTYVQIVHIYIYCMYNVYTVLVELTVLYSGHLPNLLGSLHCTVVSTSTNIYKNLSVFRQKRGCEDSPEDRDPAATLQAMAGTLYHSILPEGAVV